MAVLIEGISVIIRNDSILNKMNKGSSEFIDSVKNKVWTSDGELVCVYFMTPIDAKNYVDVLIDKGLIFKDFKGDAVDIAIVDQRQGKLTNCSWTICGYLDWEEDENKPILVCSLYSSKRREILVPDGWVYETSLTSKGLFISNKNRGENYKFLKNIDNKDIFIDLITGNEHFVKRY